MFIIFVQSIHNTETLLVYTTACCPTLHIMLCCTELYRITQDTMLNHIIQNKS